MDPEPNATPDVAAETPKFPEFDPHSFAIPGELLPDEVKAGRAAAGLPVSGIEFKSLPTEMKTTPAKRRVELWIGAFGNVDDGGDVLQKGAAERTIREDGPDGQRLIKFLWQHRTLLGPCETVEEHKHGILMVGSVDDDPSLNVYLKHAESGAAAHGSIGYEVKKASKQYVNGQAVRSLDEIKLLEGSLVIWPMNRAATVEAVKAARSGKSLYGLGDAINTLAQIRNLTAWLENIVQEGYAELSEDERQACEELFRRIESARSKAAKSAGGPSDAERAEVRSVLTKAKEFNNQLASVRALREIRGGLRQLTGGQ